ncbi:Uncharacterised protein [Streptococcus acidominimus]|uniref:Gram-positive cocci surface proteins LPxTG domain-containing protein n=1 Tax=Streptococcus acidominimus TaxID=1326 RepID=A0A239X9K4_STRAI|nr:LPXTG cell wall anchor domain-containing protein [Streptococcus acidominimus]SNV43106.1 Uncharacterised protein [Streptococcus acidominimus]
MTLIPFGTSEIYNQATFKVEEIPDGYTDGAYWKNTTGEAIYDADTQPEEPKEPTPDPYPTPDPEPTPDPQESPKSEDFLPNTGSKASLILVTLGTLILALAFLLKSRKEV